MPDRRKLVAFDPDHFAKRAASADPPDAVTAFRYAHRHNLWRGPETPSGAGSSLDQTEVIAGVVPALCERYGVQTLLDVPCGTGTWMAQVSLPGVQYIGGDIVPEIVAEADRRYGSRGRRYVELDLMRSPLPAADLLLCRDCLVHLSLADIAKVIENVRRSDITYILTTTFTAEPEYRDIVTGDWRPINLEVPPFSFPKPIEIVVEQCTEHDGAFADKSLALWRASDLPVLELR